MSGYQIYWLLIIIMMLCTVVSYTDCCLSKRMLSSNQISTQIPTKLTIATITTTTTKDTKMIQNQCSPDYHLYYCLNRGICFNYTIAKFTIPYCECTDGFFGERCERKYLSKSYGHLMNNSIRIYTASMYYGGLMVLIISLCFGYICYNYSQLMPQSHHTYSTDY